MNSLMKTGLPSRFGVFTRSSEARRLRLNELGSPSRCIPQPMKSSDTHITHQVSRRVVWPAPLAIWKRLSLLVLLGCWLGVQLQALTPGPTFILQCPHCQKPVRIHSIGSGNTFRAKFWTDGKMEAPMLPDRSPIVKCVKCNQLFWRAKAKQLARLEVFAAKEKAEQFQDAERPLDPTEQDLLDISAGRDLSRDEQMTVRRRAWWLANDRFRNSPDSKKAEFSEAQLANLRRLYSLLKDENSGERIIKAEIARQLNDFEDCLRLLKMEFQGEDEAQRATFIRELAAKRNSRVMQFPKQ